MNALVVRAIDVGYGHVKFTDGCHPTTRKIRTDSIPSQSPDSKPSSIQTSGGVMKRRDTFIVPIGDRRFEVGRDIEKAIDPNQQTEVMDDDFCLSDAYAARLLGALNYMYPGLPDGKIDILVLGLPISTYQKHKEELERRFRGTHVINTDNDTVQISHCYVYPQPMGSYVAHTFERYAGATPPTALSIDPGYNTVDWFVCQGFAPTEGRHGSVPRGMGPILRVIADEIIRNAKLDATPAGLIRKLDATLTTGREFTAYGKPFDITPYMGGGIGVIEEALQAVKNSVGAASDIDIVLLTGGGAEMFKAAVAEKFPNHEIVVLEHPAHANVIGFQLIGELLARSLEQAMHLQQPSKVPA